MEIVVDIPAGLAGDLGKTEPREALLTLTGTADRSACRRGRSKASFHRIPHTFGSTARPATRGALRLP